MLLAQQAELRDLLAKDALVGAAALLGAFLVNGECVLRIVEVEAYRGSDDPGSHAFRGPTPRNGPMFGQAGNCYVYFNYGVHWLANVTALGPGNPSAVLLRAGEPLGGLDEMRARRGHVSLSQLASGPGKLAKALSITGQANGRDLLSGAEGLHLVPARSKVEFLATQRIGLAPGKGDDLEWRFVDPTAGQWLSRPLRPRQTLRGFQADP